MVVNFVCGTWCGVKWGELLGESLWGSPLEVPPVSVFGFPSEELSHTVPVRWYPLELAGGLWGSDSASSLVFY